MVFAPSRKQEQTSNLALTQTGLNKNMVATSNNFEFCILNFELLVVPLQPILYNKVTQYGISYEIQPRRGRGEVVRVLDKA